MGPRDREWSELFEVLSGRLAQFGNGRVLEDDADYYLVDDDWGGHHQKLYVISEHFWSLRVEDAIRATLQRQFPNWGVIVVFEEGSTRHGETFVVYGDGVDTNTRFD